MKEPQARIDNLGELPCAFGIRFEECKLDEIRFGRFARGLLFMGRPLFLCRDNRKILHCQPLLLFDPNGRSPIPTARTCCSTNGEVDGLSC